MKHTYTLGLFPCDIFTQETVKIILDLLSRPAFDFLLHNLLCDLPVACHL